jgi:GNAT superfamily N-acetyltransferase
MEIPQPTNAPDVLAIRHSDESAHRLLPKADTPVTRNDPYQAPEASAHGVEFVRPDRPYNAPAAHNRGPNYAQRAPEEHARKDKAPEKAWETLELDPVLNSGLVSDASRLHQAEFEHPLDLRGDNHKIYGAAAGGRLYGFASVEINPDARSAYIDHVVVDAMYRGHQIGSRIINNVVEIVGEHGCEIVEIQAQTPLNEELYESLGFKPQGPASTIMTRPTNYHPDQFWSQ